MTIPLTLLAIHALMDFGLQTDWQAGQKSKNWYALSSHVLVYSLGFSWYGFSFVAITSLTHFLTDAVTSRMTAALWRDAERSRVAGRAFEPLLFGQSATHWFFATIGLDQLIHFVTLAWTYQVTR